MSCLTAYAVPFDWEGGSPIHQVLDMIATGSRRDEI